MRLLGWIDSFVAEGIRPDLKLIEAGALRVGKIARPQRHVDNSERLRPHRLIARFDKGKLVSLRPSIPMRASGAFGKEVEQFRIERHQQRS